jgi:jouberin
MYVFAADSTGNVVVYSVDGTRVVATYNDLGYGGPVHSISFHPFDHAVAFSSYGFSYPIMVYTWDQSEPTKEPEMEDTIGRDRDAKSLVESIVSSRLPSPTSNASACRYSGRMTPTNERATMSTAKVPLTERGQTNNSPIFRGGLSP